MKLKSYLLNHHQAFFLSLLVSKLRWTVEVTMMLLYGLFSCLSLIVMFSNSVTFVSMISFWLTCSVLMFLKLGFFIHIKSAAYKFLLLTKDLFCFWHGEGLIINCPCLLNVGWWFQTYNISSGYHTCVFLYRLVAVSK